MKRALVAALFIAAPVAGATQSGPATTRRVLGVARWLLGWR